ncbi:SUMF1/EgtB/PvdO family nonheme iron enzyme [Runella sp. MFBS21]|uniref:SUMF1/EgtB/PvdO family nonheme iron enzyme n=1 Tax=Runella sp. MFBS21 TaxID=3034018 RepID=UPI0023F74A0B|nr:SUMF1/EgtB/PvdO family nonheme iron enzyme [Runella sp. MFBS21]MDF7821565.1 SUMF1/EgtB/PvdO family nonheme iron enzyme [Runella sp. MFBS21]
MVKLSMKAATCVLAAVVLLGACKSKHPSSLNPGKKSTATNANFATKGGKGSKKGKKGADAQESDGFVVMPYKSQVVGPNLVFIEGGRFTMGALEEDVMNTRDNRERTVSVQSFYMDETEIANLHYLEYLHYIQRDSSAEVHARALPDTTVWYDPLSFNDSYVTYYFRHPGFRMFPVVGVSWVQANDYSTWRTSFVNSNLAKQANGKGKKPSTSRKSKKKGQALAESEAMMASTPARPAVESGYVLPNYRLPTEAEWEYASKAMIGTQYADENQSNQRIYPWDGSSLRNPRGKHKGEMLANFKRARGDYAGIAGKSNDGAIITEEIYKYPPNDFGLYNMAGNVNEWVYDVYRPLSYMDFKDLNPLRRDGFLDESKRYDSKNSNSVVNDKLRVYKGGSWNDVAYWLSPGTRRFLDQDSATAMIGFRCAMISTGRNK